MKLISKFKNRYNNITYKIYETENSIKVLHLDNPSTIDFDFAIIIRAGCSFEMQERVHRGTAHFLEHMLLNPNSIFKNKEEIDQFEQGSKNRPAIEINATTTRKNIYITSHTNRKGYLRSMQRLESILDFPKEKFASQLEKERGIILAEKSRKPRKDKDPYLSGLEFLFKGLQEEFSYDVLGEPEDIKEITINDLERYFNRRFVSNNCVFTIQSSGDLNQNVIRKLEQISRKIPNGEQKIQKDVVLRNKWKVGSFVDDRANGVTFSFLYFDKIDSQINYKEYAIKYITYRLLDWLAFDILREKQSLIYDFSPFQNVGLSYYYDIRGFRFTTEKEKIEKTLKELYDMLHTYAFEFLNSKKGIEWFDDVISFYVFPRSIKFSNELAEDAATAILEDREIFNTNISVKEAKTIKITDIEKYLRYLIDTPPHIWVEADMQKDEMKMIANTSLFAKKFDKD